MAVVYRVTSPSGKSYIGVAKRTAQERFKKHCNNAKNGHTTAICNAIRKYGPDALKLETLVESTSEYCFDLEIKAIKAFNTVYPHGYNLTSGGEGVHDMADISKEKHKASLNSPACKQSRIEKLKKVKNEPKAKEAVSAQMRKRWQTEEWRLLMKKVASEKRAEKAKKPVVKKKCIFCFEEFMCMKKVSAYKMYCSRKCSSKASHEMRKERNERF